MRKITWLLLITIFITTILTAKTMKQQRKVLLDSDKELSQLVQDKGIFDAFYGAMADEGVILPGDGNPIIGRKAFLGLAPQIRQRFTQSQVRWIPLLADVSVSGDLGYTYGRYLIKSNNDTSGEVAGYYASIWEKSNQGKWQLVFCQGLLQMKISNSAPPGNNNPEATEREKKSLIATELAFSKLSLDRGLHTAFAHYIADDGITLSSSGQPNNKSFYLRMSAGESKKEDKNQLQWKPIYTRVAKAGDLGYNYGPYILRTTNNQGKRRILQGYFFTIWKKQPDRKWKFVIDAGNIKSEESNYNKE